MAATSYEFQGLYDGIWKANVDNLDESSAKSQYRVFLDNPYMRRFPWRVAKTTRIIVPGTTVRRGWFIPEYLLAEKSTPYQPAGPAEIYFNLQGMWHGQWLDCPHWFKCTCIQTLEEATKTLNEWTRHEERQLRLTQVFVEPVDGFIYMPEILDAAV